LVNFQDSRLRQSIHNWVGKRKQWKSQHFHSPKTGSQAHLKTELHIIRCTCLSPLACTRLQAYNSYRLKIKTTVRHKSSKPSSYPFHHLVRWKSYAALRYSTAQTTSRNSSACSIMTRSGLMLGTWRSVKNRKFCSQEVIPYFVLKTQEHALHQGCQVGHSLAYFETYGLFEVSCPSKNRFGHFIKIKFFTVW